MTGRLVIMGSGETAPTMVEVHRATLRAAGEGPSLLLDTPYGFQENADDITAKAVAYFGRNVGRTVGPLVWRTRLDGAALDRALTAVRTARSVFAGPGSPTYALRVWAGTGFDDALAAVAASGGTVTFASAAALTNGVVTVPVYEIYKSGVDPAWARAFIAGFTEARRSASWRPLMCGITTSVSRRWIVAGNCSQIRNASPAFDASSTL